MVCELLARLPKLRDEEFNELLFHEKAKLEKKVDDTKF